MLQNIYNQIRENKISITQGAKQMGVSTYKLKQFFQNNGYEDIIKQPGRLQNTISEQEIQNVQNYRNDFRVGYKRTADSLQRHGITINENKVKHIFKAEELFIHKKPKPKEKHTKRFYAKYKDQQWNTDLHELTFIYQGKQYKVYLISFIDDATRFIIHAEILPAKDYQLAANALINDFKTGLKPCFLHAGNGGEFVGKEFQKAMEDNGIEWTHSRPYTPQMNGKIERWWETLDGAMVSQDRIYSVIHEYNFYWSHSSHT